MSESIVFRTPNWLGDAVMATVIPPAIRRKHPSCRLTVLTPAPLGDLFVHSPDVDEVVGLASGGDVDAYRTGRYDSVLLAPTSFGSAWRAWRGGVPRRFGFATSRRRWLLKRTLPGSQYRRDRHQVENYRALAGLVGRPDANDEPAVHLDERWRAHAAALWPAGERRVAIQPGATYGPAKRWAPSRFAQVADALSDRGWTVAVLGGPADRDIVRSRCRCPVADLAGKTTIGALTAILKEAHLLITNDTGPMHLAAAVGTQTLAIFGSTNPNWTRPYGLEHRVVQHEVPCAPCYQRTCDIGYLCLEGITTEAVVAHALAMGEPWT